MFRIIKETVTIEDNFHFNVRFHGSETKPSLADPAKQVTTPAEIMTIMTDDRNKSLSAQPEAYADKETKNKALLNVRVYDILSKFLTENINQIINASNGAIKDIVPIARYDLSSVINFDLDPKATAEQIKPGVDAIKDVIKTNLTAIKADLLAARVDLGLVKANPKAVGAAVAAAGKEQLTSFIDFDAFYNAAQAARAAIEANEGKLPKTTGKKREDLILAATGAFYNVAAGNLDLAAAKEAVRQVLVLEFGFISSAAGSQNTTIDTLANGAVEFATKSRARG